MKDKKFWIGIIISGIFLWLSLKDIRWADVRVSFSGVQYEYLALCLFVFIIGHLFRSLRWQYLLIRIKKIPVYDLFSIIMIANLLLSTLPARIGEFIRAYLLGKRHNISKTASFSTIVVERTFDGCFSLLFFVMALWLYPGDLHMSIPGVPDFSLKKAIAGIFLIYIAVLIFLLILRSFPEKTVTIINSITRYFPQSVQQKITNIINAFISGLGVFKDKQALLVSSLLSGIVWTLLAFGYYLGLLGFDIRDNFYMSFILVGFVVIAVMIPAAPGFVGTFHFAVQLCLQKFYNVSPAVAVSYGWVIWICGMMVNIIPGLYYFNKFNLEMSQITKLERDA